MQNFFDVFLLLGSLLRAFSSEHPLGSRKIWLDFDVSAGIPNRDVDDALCLFALLNDPVVNLVGVSVTFGNANLSEALHIANVIAFLCLNSLNRRLISYDVTIHPYSHLSLSTLLEKYSSRNIAADEGAREPQTYWERTPAIQRMDEVFSTLKDSETITVLCVGPATNIASFITQLPHHAEHISEVVLVAGRRPGYLFTTGENREVRHPDLNFEKDTNAFQILLNTSVPLTYLPFELSSKIEITQHDLRYLNESGEELGEYIFSLCVPWINLWSDLFNVDFFHPFDSMAPLYISHPRAVICEDMFSWIQFDRDDAAHTSLQGSGGSSSNVKKYLYVGVEPESTVVPYRRVKFCYDIQDGTKDIILESLLPSTKSAGHMSEL